MHQSKVLKWSLILGIVIVLNLFFNYTLSLVYSAPDYNEYCSAKQVIKEIPDESSCLAQGGQWNENVYNQEITKGYCDQNFTCNNDYQLANSDYEKNVFVALVVIGVVIIIASLFISAGEVLSVALSLGGVLSLVIASMRYWSSAGEVLKVIILGVALASLIWLAIKKFKDKV